MRRFGGDRGIVGRSITLDGEPTEVIGVMPAAFSFPDYAKRASGRLHNRRRATASFLFNLTGVARLRDGANGRERARTEITALIQDLSRRVPESEWASSQQPCRSRRPSLVASPTRCGFCWRRPVLCLLVACANVANLFLVRSETRQREVAVRRALGRGWSQHRPLLLLGKRAARGGRRSRRASRSHGAASSCSWPSARRHLPRLNEVRIDGVVLVFSLALSLISAAAFGIIPLCVSRL